MCSALFSALWIKERVAFMCNTPVPVHGLKNEIYSCVTRLLRLYGLKNEIYSCVARLFRLCGLKNEIYSRVARLGSMRIK